MALSIKEQVVAELKTLSEAELKEVAEYLAFLKFRARRAAPTLDEAQLATLYAEFADEDRNLAEEGIADYAEGLLEEDVR
jgi:DNA-binding GntR family transcriptional regulator